MPRSYKDEDGKWLYPEEVKKNPDGSATHAETGASIAIGRSEVMSKSKKNVVDPGRIIDSYGADTARLFMLSDSPPDRDLEWTDAGVDGAWRYIINRLWRLTYEYTSGYWLYKDLGRDRVYKIILWPGTKDYTIAKKSLEKFFQGRPQWGRNNKFFVFQTPMDSCLGLMLTNRMQKQC